MLFTYWHAFDRARAWGAEMDHPARLLDELRALGVRAEGLELDLSAAAAPRLLLDAVEERLGPLHILVNNAAHSMRAGYETLDAETLDLHYAVNVRAPALLSAEFARRFAAGAGGRIINLVTGSSLGAMSCEIPYATTKGAMETFTRTLAPAVAEKGITVNAVDPGPTDTGWMAPQLRDDIRSRFPLGRIGQPEDAARLVAFLVSDEAEWITGQIIHSEGGFNRG